MFMLGFALLGSTLLLPLFTQTLLGYTAETAGMGSLQAALPSCCCCRWSGSCSLATTRWLMALGLTVLSLSLYHMTSFDLEVDSARSCWRE